MYCNKCGQPINDNAAYCEHCGQPRQEVEQQPVIIPPPMKWFKFLIYFSLFAGAVLNFINGVTTILGVQYGEYAEQVYAAFESLQAFDIFCGIYLILLAIFTIYVRFRLSGFRKNGPKLFMFVYIAIIVFSIIQLAGSMAILPRESWGDLNFTSVTTSIITNITYMVINYTYLHKRAHLFVN